MSTPSDHPGSVHQRLPQNLVPGASRVVGPAVEHDESPVPADVAEGRRLVAEANAGIVAMQQAAAAALPPAVPFASIQDFVQSQRDPAEHARRLLVTPQSVIDSWS
jgi:hypothetical protein